MNKFVFRIHDSNHFDSTPIVNMYEIETNADYEKIAEIHNIIKSHYEKVSCDKIIIVCKNLKAEGYICNYRMINFDFSL